MEVAPKNTLSCSLPLTLSLTRVGTPSPCVNSALTLLQAQAIAKGNPCTEARDYTRDIKTKRQEGKLRIYLHESIIVQKLKYISYYSHAEVFILGRQKHGQNTK